MTNGDKVMIKSFPRKCYVCKLYSKDIQKHHLTPKSCKFKHKIPMSYLKNNNIVVMCGNCHKLAHMVWGPGDSYVGPRFKPHFLTGLRKIFVENFGSVRNENHYRGRIGNLKSHLKTIGHKP